MSLLENAKTILKTAHSYLKNDQTQLALDLYLQILQEDENHPLALYNAGLCYRKLNQWVLAEKMFTTLAEKGAHPLVIRQLADLAFLQQHYHSAMTFFQQFLGLAEGDHALYFNLATCYLQMDQTVMAQFYYQRALEYDTHDSETYFNLGIIAQHSQEFAQALAHYEQALKIQENHYAALINTGVCYLKLERRSDAIAIYRRAQQLYPHAEQVNFTLAALEGKQMLRAPAAYLTGLFDHYAARYDTVMETELNYQLPSILAKTLTEEMFFEKQVIEFGCGTGLIGKQLKNFKHKVIGIDLSEKMLSKARQTHCYENLICGDFMAVLSSQKAISDIIVAMDVFVYLGDLDATLALCHRLLLPNGMLLFNTEITEQSDYYLQQNGRYAHHQNYLKLLAKRHGFAKFEISTVSIRQDQGNMVSGYWVKMM